MSSTPGVNLLKLFWCKFTLMFCKLDYFMNTKNIFCIGMKRSSFEKECEFMPKRSNEIDSLGLYYQNFYGSVFRVS